MKRVYILDNNIKVEILGSENRTALQENVLVLWRYVLKNQEGKYHVCYFLKKCFSKTVWGDIERESDVSRRSKILTLANIGKGTCGCLQYCPCNIFKGLKVFKIKFGGMKQISGLYLCMNTSREKNVNSSKMTEIWSRMIFGLSIHLVAQPKKNHSYPSFSVLILTLTFCSSTVLSSLPSEWLHSLLIYCEHPSLTSTLKGALAIEVIHLEASTPTLPLSTPQKLS